MVQTELAPLLKLPNTIEELLSDSASRSAQFPVVSEYIYLAHAAVAPIPACGARAISEYAARAAKESQFEPLHGAVELQTRERAATLMGASSAEIAFVPSTSAGISMVAEGLDWRQGDNVVIAAGDFPSNVYPWLALRDRGVEVRQVPSSLTCLTVDDLSRTVDNRTRLVSLSSVHYVTGAAIDLDTIGAFLRARRILFCVDAIQSLGAWPTSVEHVDFLVADAHKWLLGPQGIGVLYVRRERFDQLRPVLTGWKTIRNTRDYSRIQSEFPDSAQRYEPGSLNVLGLVGLHASLGLLLHFGVPAIQVRLQSLRTRLFEGLRQKGCNILGENEHHQNSAIVSARNSQWQPKQKMRELQSRRFIVSMRTAADGMTYLRFSPHFYNSNEDVDMLLKALE